MSKHFWPIALALAVMSAPAQDWASSGPPKVLSITTEVLKPDQASTHEKTESGWPRAFTKANWPYHWLAISSITGEDRVLFLTGYKSFADSQADDDQQNALEWLSAEQERLAIEDSVFVASKSHQIAAYIPELSLRSRMSLGGSRLLLMTTVDVEPAREAEFRKQMQARMTIKQRETGGQHYATYRMLLGAPEATFLLLQPLENRDALEKLFWNSVNSLPTAGVKSIRHDLMAFSPSMSYVSKEFAAGNTQFWLPN